MTVELHCALWKKKQKTNPTIKLSIKQLEGFNDKENSKYVSI